MSRYAASGATGEEMALDVGWGAVPTGHRPGARRRVVSRVPRGDHPPCRSNLRLLRLSVDDATFLSSNPEPVVAHVNGTRSGAAAKLVDQTGVEPFEAQSSK